MREVRKLYVAVATFMAAISADSLAQAHFHHVRHHAHHAYMRAAYVRADADQVVEHPHGCPWRVFCGCGAADYLLGAPIRSLWLAANWYRFPRTTPRAGAAAVKPHHVVAIIEAHGSDRALVYDANSGHHLTRIHEISLAGFTIVDPHGGSGSYASVRHAHLRQQQQFVEPTPVSYGVAID